VTVVDASALLEVLLRTPAAARLERRLLAPGQTLCAPHLIDLEITQALRRYLAARQLTPVRAAEALQDLEDFPLLRYPHQPFLARIWELRHNFTAYDAAYVVLAEALEAALVTRDRALAAAPGHRARVEVV
jgi:predicted nucleic acid-binding protein